MRGITIQVEMVFDKDKMNGIKICLKVLAILFHSALHILYQCIELSQKRLFYKLKILE